MIYIKFFLARQNILYYIMVKKRTILITITITSLLIILVLVKVFSMRAKNKSNEMVNNFTQKTKVYYINLDKNTKRNNELKQAYAETDLQIMPLNRFSAIVGKEVVLEDWLAPDTIKEVNEIEKTRIRTHHYQMTKGGVGCFLSHYTLAKQLLKDSTVDYYLILEDDIILKNDILEEINHYLPILPSDWDIIQLSTLRKINSKQVGEFYKPAGFWGMQSYIINKKGAKKLVNEVKKTKIDGQIDAYLSRMIQQNKMNLYITNRRLVILNEDSSLSDIQCKVVKKKLTDNPYMYKGYLV